MSSRWLEEYLKDAKVSNEDLRKRSFARRFRMGKMVYLNEIEVTFSIVMKTDADGFVKREIVASVIN